MKLFNLLLFSLIIFSCNNGKNLEFVEDTPIQPRSTNSQFQTLVGSNFVLIYDEDTNTFYKLRTTNQVSLPDNISEITHRNKTLTLFSSLNGNSANFSIYDENIKMISSFINDQEFYESVFRFNSLGERVWLDDAGDRKPKCDCSGGDPNSNCDSGGIGAVHCKVADGNGKTCEVDCEGGGSYACCIIDDGTGN